MEKVLDPRSAVKDADKMASDSVKKDLDALKKYQTATKEITAMLVRPALFCSLPSLCARMTKRQPYRLPLEGGAGRLVWTCPRGGYFVGPPPLSLVCGWTSSKALTMIHFLDF